MIQAITNIQIGLNVFTEFIISYMQPGKPLAMMSFKVSIFSTFFFLSPTHQRRHTVTSVSTKPLCTVKISSLATT